MWLAQKEFWLIIWRQLIAINDTAPSSAVEVSTQPMPVDDENWHARRSETERQGEEFVVDAGIFEGPLDLLLAMARTQKVDLACISVLALAEQYLAFIADAKRLRLELAADYLVMAAWLTFLKSRLLLPREEIPDDGQSGEELAQRLAFRLMRLEAMRDAATHLLNRHRLGRDVLARGQPETVVTTRETHYTTDLYNLVKAYATQRKRTLPHVHVVKKRTVWSIKDARSRLERLVGPVSGNWLELDQCIEDYLGPIAECRTILASSLGAILEMAHEGLVDIRQDEPFGVIFVRRREAGAQWQKWELKR